MRGIIFAGLVLAAGLSACAEQPNKPAPLAASMAQFPPYEHGRLTTHLQRIAGFIGNAAKMRVTVTMLDSPEPNGFALPDGSVYLTRGLVMLARSDEDWADMISHQIAHLTVARDQRSTLDRFLDIGQAMLNRLMIWQEGEEAPAGPAMRPFTAAEEAIVNRAGLKLMVAAAYSPASVASGRDRIRRFSQYRAQALGRRDTNTLHDLHPYDAADFAVAVESSGTVTDGPTTGSLFQPLLDGMIYGDGVRAGLIKGHTLLHPGLGLAFDVPKEVKLRIEAQAIHGQGPNGIDIRLEPSDFRGDASGAVVEWGRNAGVRRAERITIAERAAATGLMRDGDGGPMARLIALPNESGQMWRVQVSAPGADAQALTQIAQEIAAAARPLTDAERRQTAPLHLRLSPAPAAPELRRRIAGQPVPQPQLLFEALNEFPAGALPKPGYRIVLVGP